VSARRVVALTVLAASLGAVACHGGSAGESRATSGAHVAELERADAARPPASPFDLPALVVAADDSRLASVREKERAKDYAGAARVVEQARTSFASEPAASCAWAYLAGRLHLAGNELVEAIAAFDAVLAPGSSSCALAPYASLRSAQALTRSGRFEDGVNRARTIPRDRIVLVDEAKVVLAEALAGKGDRVAAVALWRELLAETPHATRWVDTAVRLATALDDGIDGAPASKAKEALDLATRVVVEAPKLADASGAERERLRALALLRASDPKLTDALSEDDRVRRVKSWLDASEPAKALVDANAVYGAWPPPGRTGTLACSLTTYRAQAMVRTKVPSADAWGDAIRACVGDDQLAGALFQGGKASLSAKRGQEGLERLAKTEQQFPKHRLADDARLIAAMSLKDAGDEARFSSMLLSLPDDYPEGDMRTEGLFRVALLRMTKGDWAGAKDPLDRILSIEPDDRHWATAGRALYFRARVAAMTGDADGAIARYVKIIESYPLAFYMTQAYGRLAAIDDARAVKTLDDAVAREPQGRFFTREHPELHTAEFDRAKALLEVGEIDTAKRELSQAGYTADTADKELVWAIAAVYDRAGAHDISHSFTRTRLYDHLPHYPSGMWRLPWEVSFPRAYEPLVVKESAANDIPTALTWGIMREESSFLVDVKSPANAYGLMQLVVPTAKMVASGTGLPWDAESLKRPEVNIALGTKMLGQLRGSFFVNRSLAIAAYNGGPGAVRRWVDARSSEDFDLFVEEIPYDETRGYIKRVLGSQAAYAFLYARPSLEEVLTIPTHVSVRASAVPPASSADASDSR
jgi:soluble lytic murein transglycosylase